MRRFNLNSSQNNTLLDMSSKMDLMPYHRPTNPRTKNKNAKSIDTSYQINPLHDCLKICDKRICQISQTCIQRSESYTFDEHDNKMLPTIGQIPEYEELINTDGSAIRSHPVFKNLNRSLVSSLLIHFSIIGVIVSLIAWLEPHLAPNLSNQNSTSLIEVVMVDTHSMEILPTNHVKVPTSLAQMVKINHALPNAEEITTAEIEPVQEKLTSIIPTDVNFFEPSLENSSSSSLPILGPIPAVPTSAPNIIPKDNTKASNLPSNQSKTTVDNTSKSQKSTSPDKQAQKKPIKSVTPVIHNEKKRARSKEKDITKVPSKNKHNTDPLARSESLNQYSQISSTSTQKTTSEIRSASQNNSLTNKSTAPSSTNNLATPLKRPYPAYPSRAAALNQEGSVVVRFDVNSNGKVENIRIIASTPSNIFDSEVKRAMRKWLYEGKTTKDLTVTFNFKLTGIAII